MEERSAPAAEAMSRFVHWGYWEEGAPGGPGTFPAAMERLNAEVLKAAELSDGQSLLDAGCGFGGTLQALSSSFPAMRLAGLNIDGRQLVLAREHAKAARFAVGDACALPFASAALDRVLAVECIFHFPSRLSFIKEAARVLKPGGVLALSDFVPLRPNGKVSWLGNWLGREVGRGYGVLGTGWPDGDYAAMARAAGFEVILDRDITERTLPTYPIMLGFLSGQPGSSDLRWATRLLQWSSLLGFLRYRIVAFRKPG